MDKIFGGPIVPTLLRLLILSFFVGLAFAAFGIDPLDLWSDFWQTFQDAWRYAGDFINWGFKYAVLGAIVVLPLWIIYRLLRAISSPKKS
ncbi:MAG: hypothetical protein GC190_14560 [Alphaproteobacteria bacterium]|nr:hypothetical protein [Alphaproteobacteria bacterium]